MNFDFAAAMRRALQLTRARDVVGATRVIQAALSGRRPTDADHLRPIDLTVPQPPEHGAPPLIAPRAGNVEEPRPPLPRTDAAKPHAQAPEIASPGTRLRKPLGEVLERLREGKGKIGNLDWPPELRTRRQPPPTPEGALFVERSFACPAGVRSYKLYVPASARKQPNALVVMLHGCKQHPDDFAAGTNMNALAEEYGIVVAYPGQARSANASSCWNWFRPTDQMRDAGEPAIIAGLTREVCSQFGLDRQQVFIAGLSAGGAMAAVMAETYPDLYAAVGIHSGLAYGSANDVLSAFAAMRGETGMARQTKPALKDARLAIRTIVFQGSADATVHPSNAERIVAAVQATATPLHAWEESGASTAGRSYVRSVLTSPDGDAVLEYWRIAGAGHAWSGGNPAGSYTDPSGPDASAEMMRFFFAPLSKRTRRAGRSR